MDERLERMKTVLLFRLRIQQYESPDRSEFFVWFGPHAQQIGMVASCFWSNFVH